MGSIFSTTESSHQNTSSLRNCIIHYKTTIAPTNYLLVAGWISPLLTGLAKEDRRAEVLEVRPGASRNAFGTIDPIAAAAGIEQGIPAGIITVFASD